MTEEIHIAGSTALGRFVINMNFIWIMFLSWAYPILVNMLANKRLQRIHPSHKLQRMNVKRKRNAFLNMWNYFNIVVLWLDILVIAYCHARSGNCVLIYESETSHTDGLAMLIVNIVICYVAQIYIFNWLYKDKYMNFTNFLSTTFHDEVSRLIYRDVATVKWMAKCGHWNYHGRSSRFVSTHTEVFYLF